MTPFPFPSVHLTPRTGSLVERYLFSPLYAPRSVWNVLGWWERRRAFYNLLVGSAGLLTVLVAQVQRLVAPAFEGPPLAFIVAYALAANIFYSLGAPIHLLFRRTLKESAGPVAQAMFRYGLAFSLGLTLLPIPLILLSTLIRVIVGR